MTGQSYTLTGVQKQGYQLCDPDMLGRAFRFSKNPLIVVLETSDNITADRLNSERKIRRMLEKQLHEKEDELEALKEQQVITEAEYLQQLQELYKEQQGNENLIAEMAERYATLDFDQMDDFHRKVAFFIQNGELARADSLLHTKGNMEERSVQLDRMAVSIKEDADELAKRQEAHEKSVEMRNQVLEDFAADCFNYFEICKLQHKNDSAAYWMELRASKDTLNLQWMLEAGLVYDVYCVQPDKARQIFQRAYNISLQQYGEADWHTALCLQNLAANCSLVNKFAEAMAYYERERQLLDLTYGKEWPIQALSWYLNVAGTALEIEETDKAIEYVQTYIDALTAIEGEEAAKLAGAYNNLASIYKRLGNYEKSKPLYLKAIEIGEKQSERKPEQLATFHNNLGVLYTQLEERDHAMDEHMKAYDLYVEAYGETHPQTAIALNALGTGYYRQGKLNEAFEQFSKALDIMMNSYGEHHLATATIYNNIAMIYTEAGMYDEALSMLQKEVDIKRAILGEDHLSTAEAYEQLGMIYSYLKQYDEAIQCIEKAMKRKIQALGEDHVRLATSYINLASMLSKHTDFELAESYYNKAIDILTKAYGDNSQYLPDCYKNLGVLYYNQQRFQQSYDTCKKGLDIFIKVNGDRHPGIVGQYENLAYCCDELKRHIESLDYRKKALALLVDTYGQDHRRTCESYADAVAHLQLALQTDDSAELRQAYNDFMAGLIYMIDCIEGDTPAHQQGLAGEYYLFQYEDWTPDSHEVLQIVNNRLKGKPKTLMIMDTDGHVSSHRFENVIGANFLIKYIGKEEKQRILRLYESNRPQ